MNHTPTPWQVAQIVSMAGAGGTSLRTVIEFAGTPTRTALDIATITPEDDNGEAIREASANAAHIVRCVNAHDSLVHALRLMRTCFGTHTDPWAKEALSTADAALAKVQPQAEQPRRTMTDDEREIFELRR